MLLTGGAGYIGSHAAVALLEAGYSPIIFDNFSNSSTSVIGRIEKISGHKIISIRGDVNNLNSLIDALQKYECSAVMHFAARKSVGESTQIPLKYYSNNLCGLIALLTAMEMTGCKKLVYSSSATVYGEASESPLNELCPTEFTNPYAHTKLVGEQILSSLIKSDPSWIVGVLRYFNPAGAHESGLLGEAPLGIPNNLMPYLAQVASGQLEKLRIFGSDYPTSDGTGVRDYIHVMDLAEGHAASLSLLERNSSHVVNLGTGIGYSVMEVIAAYEKACNKKISYEFVARRPGDTSIAFANPEKARKILGWSAKRDLDEICKSSWSWVANKLSN